HIRAWGGAQGFRTTSGEKLRVRNSGGHILHYGFALEPTQARIRKANLSALYGGKKYAQSSSPQEVGFYEPHQKVLLFRGPHPAVMRDVAAAATSKYESRAPLIRFRRNYFWEDVALVIKRCTGISLGVHKNYRLLR